MKHRKDRGPGCLRFGRGLRHALAFVHTLHRRCVINQESVPRVAMQLGLEYAQVAGVVRLLKSIRFIPSFERLALIAQRDPGLDDDDIAEIFGTIPEWSAEVRERAADIRAHEHIPAKCEVLTEEDFLSAEVAARLTDVRRTRVVPARGMEARTGNIKAYSWSRSRASFFQIGIE